MNPPDPAQRLARFVRHLRDEGFDVGMRETQAALRAAAAGRALDRQLMGNCLRSLCCRNREDWQRFALAFERFWFPAAAPARETAAAQVDPRLARRSGGITGLAGSSSPQAFDEALEQGGGAGRQHTLARADFRFVTDRRGQRALEEIAARLALRIRRRVSRRRRVAHRGRVIHMRRTLRHALASAGEPLRLRYSAPRLQLPRLVLLQDVSHSMAGYTPLLTRYARGLLRVFPRCETFVFHTRLYRVTHLYREADPLALKRRLEHYQHLWLGGTQIAGSLAAFRLEHGSRLLDRHTLVVILSDGFDSDEPQRLAAELARLRERARRLVWINPMLGRRDAATEPAGDISRGLAALVDFVAPGHSLDGLRQAADYLARQA